MVTSEKDSSSNSDSLILKTDAVGRVKTPLERREFLLAEFSRSGLSGKQFAKLSGIKYSTFTYWLQRRKHKAQGSTSTPAEAQQVSWLEAVVEQPSSSKAQGLLLHLPGGVRAELTSSRHIDLAAALVRALEKPC